jgi:plasmid stability protein
MRNITVTVSDEVYARARTWAARHDSSVSAVVQYMLSTLSTERRARAFAAAREQNPGIRRPIAPTPPPRPAEPATAELAIAEPAAAEPDANVTTPTPLPIQKTAL